MKLYAHTFTTPAGRMLAAVDERGRLVRLEFLTQHRRERIVAALERAGHTVEWKEEPCAPVVAQIGDYFAGERQAFDLEIAPEGTPFQRQVWRQLGKIPYGETRSYGEIAARLGRPKGARAAGGAIGSNPIVVVIPCHRVIGADGSLTGFGSGLPVKRKLLRLEGVLP